MACEIPALLAALKLALSMMPGGSIEYGLSYTLELTPCTFPTFHSETIQCNLDKQKYKEKAYRDVEAVIEACEADDERG